MPTDRDAMHAASLFSPGCTCSSYGHGLTMTRVTSPDCVIHGSRHVRGTGWLAEKITGARIDYVEQRDDGLFVLTFRHRGTDDGFGYLIVSSSEIHFADEAGVSGAD